MVTKRDYLIDNCKAILIFFVVWAHFLEFIYSDLSYTLQLIIYWFHMPVFVYFSGYLAKYNPQKILKSIIIPYFCVQIFGFFYYSAMGLTNDFRLLASYSTLWYMIALTFWYVSIPFVEKVKKPPLLIFGTIIFALIIGYDNSVGYSLSASRTIVFYPFFLLGYFSNTKKWFQFKNNKNIYRIIVASLLVVTSILTIVFKDIINVEWMYNSQSYASLNYSPIFRTMNYLISFLWILGFILFMPKKQNILSKIGKNTLPVYLLHYFIVYAIYKTGIFSVQGYAVLASFVFSIIIVFVLSRDCFKKIFGR